MKYASQRELFLEVLLFARQLAQKKTVTDSENMTNPNHELETQKSVKKFLKKLLKVETLAPLDSKTFKVLSNDRITPTKILYKCQVFKKGGGLLSSEKKMWLFLGVTSIIISK